MLLGMGSRSRSWLASTSLLALACGTSGVAPQTEAPEKRSTPMMQSTDAASGSASAVTVEGLRTKRSESDFTRTVGRAEAAIESRGLTLIARIDHGENAERVGMELRPTTLLVFGNPEVGTRLMQARQRIGIDLPLKLLVWEDERGEVHVAYEDPAWIAERHAVSGEDPVIEKMQTALDGIASEAAQ
jgi:uncharacterized protein (DUF302 family)